MPLLVIPAGFLHINVFGFQLILILDSYSCHIVAVHVCLFRRSLTYENLLFVGYQFSKIAINSKASLKLSRTSRLEGS
jgi:hypothetical protein